MEKRGEKPFIKYVFNISAGLYGNNRLVILLDGTNIQNKK